MKRVILLLTLYLSVTQLYGQGQVGSWADHLPYRSIKKVVAGEHEVYGATDWAISIYNSEYNESKKLSKVHGLTECGISTIGYSNSNQTLIVAYNTTNIDLYKDGTVTNIPDILNKYVAGKKEISKIRTHGAFAYLLSSFGIIILDVDRAEIKDTWNPSVTGGSTEVFDIAFLDNLVYASTSEGFMYASIDNPALTYFESWNLVQGFSQDGIYKNLAAAGNSIFISKSASGGEGDSLLRYSDGIITILSAEPDQVIYTVESANSSILVNKGSEIEIYDPNGTVQRVIDDYDWGTPGARNSTIGADGLYIADSEFGIVREYSSGSFESIMIPGPYVNSSASIHSEKGTVYVAGGVVDNAWNNTWTYWQSLFFENRSWWSGIHHDSWDVMRIRPFPDQPGRVAVSTWGSGLYEIDNHEIVEHYMDDNSPLETIIPGSNYVRICGLAFDENRNLWVTQTGVENSIKVLTPDKNWIVLPYTIEAPTIGDIIITRTGIKWIVLPRGHGLFILDDNRTPENFGDDIWKKITVTDQDGRVLNTIYSIAEDLNGNIWIGTDQGPAVYYNPDKVLADDINCYRIKVPRNDGSGLADYLLGTETINSVSIDGGNRKWFGTNSSGIFLISEDGSELIKSYNEDNSPLLSNTITSIDVDDTTGEVWIGTDKGIVTVRESATKGDDNLGKVYAFPNPIRPDFNGSVTITGLARNSNVKITDISGNLVYEATSTGGQAIWDLKIYNGDRVASGVYLAYCSTEDGSASRVIKILVVR